MCGTPSASRATVARAAIGAAISPEVWGSGRQANQYAAAKNCDQQNGYAQIDRPQ